MSKENKLDFIIETFLEWASERSFSFDDYFPCSKTIIFAKSFNDNMGAVWVVFHTPKYKSKDYVAYFDWDSIPPIVTNKVKTYFKNHNIDTTIIDVTNTKL